LTVQIRPGPAKERNGQVLPAENFSQGMKVQRVAAGFPRHRVIIPRIANCWLVHWEKFPSVI